MSHVVTDSCIACKYTDCVEMCPVDCFHEGPNFLVIDPEECIDCGLCVSECPVGAIKELYNLNENEQDFIDINENLSKQWPIIRLQKAALPDAAHHVGMKNKINLLIKD